MTENILFEKMAIGKGKAGRKRATVITDRQKKFALVFAATNSVKEASEQANVSTTTGQAYVKNDLVQAEIHSLRSIGAEGTVLSFIKKREILHSIATGERLQEVPNFKDGGVILVKPSNRDIIQALELDAKLSGDLVNRHEITQHIQTTLKPKVINLEDFIEGDFTEIVEDDISFSDMVFEGDE